MGVQVLRVLEKYSGCCLDNEEERMKVARAIERALDNELCDDCAHELDVHQRDANGKQSSCLGGPAIYHQCNCHGFRKER